MLADERSVALPFIKRLPKNDPVLLRALKNGVEVGQDGEVVGLLTVYPSGGNDPYYWYTKSINLSDLAGLMDPDGIDDSIVPTELINDLKENESRSLDRHGLPCLVLHKAHKMRKIYESCERRINEQPYVIGLFSQEHIDQ